MKTLNTILTLASLFTGPAAVSAAVAASETNPVFGGNVSGPDLYGSFEGPWIEARNRTLASGAVSLPMQ